MKFESTTHSHNLIMIHIIHFFMFYIYFILFWLLSLRFILVKMLHNKVHNTRVKDVSFTFDIIFMMWNTWVFFFYAIFTIHFNFSLPSTASIIHWNITFFILLYLLLLWWLDCRETKVPCFCCVFYFAILILSCQRKWGFMEMNNILFIISSFIFWKQKKSRTKISAVLHVCRW